jgi:hypothetical protein
MYTYSEIIMCLLFFFERIDIFKIIGAILDDDANNGNFVKYL